MRQAFDISVGTSVVGGIVDVDIFVGGPVSRIHRTMVNGDQMFCFEFILSEAKTLRDTLNDAIEHLESGGHG